jgi:uncharacterized membrane protein YidH (DUF202 family)
LNPFKGLYSEAGEVYKTRLHRIIALALIPIGFLVAANNFSIASQPDPGCTLGCPADYTLLGVWLIVVPITAMGLANYYLVMKPTIERKKRTHGMMAGLKMGEKTNGRTGN